MSKSRDRVLQALNHQNTDYVPVDFGSTAVTGIHCRSVEALRNHYFKCWVKLMRNLQNCWE